MLIEAAIALLIVGLVAVATLSLAGAELRTTERARGLVEARVLATDRLDRTRLLPESLLVRLPDSLARGRFDSPFDRYEWSIEATRRAQRNDLIDLAVGVSWESGSYRLRTSVHRANRNTRVSP